MKEHDDFIGRGGDDRIMKLPDLTSEDEERAFWKKRSIADYWEDLTETDDTFGRPKLTSVTLRFDPLLLKKIKMLADKRGIPYNAYIRYLLSDLEFTRREFLCNSTIAIYHVEITGLSINLCAHLCNMEVNTEIKHPTIVIPAEAGHVVTRSKAQAPTIEEPLLDIENNNALKSFTSIWFSRIMQHISSAYTMCDVEI